MKRLGIFIITSILFCFSAAAQTKPADTLVIKVGSGSKLILRIADKKDLATMKRYDFQSIITDMITKLENRDSTTQLQASNYIKDTTQIRVEIPIVNREVIKTGEQEEDWKSVKRTYRGRRTYRSFNFDLGTNNYLNDGKFPDQDNSLYTVRPWGSWYLSLNHTYRTRVAKKFFLEWGMGASWYNFKFQNNSILVSKDDNSVIFSEDTRDASFRKSKLSVTYLNASLVPVLDFGNNKRKPGFWKDHHNSGFHIGAGAYAGYRINSYAKQVFREDGDRDRSRTNNNFYLNNFRYGLRAQIGYNDIDFFFNYDLNDLFATNKGPQLNAFSFGVSF